MVCTSLSPSLSPPLLVSSSVHKRLFFTREYYPVLVPASQASRPAVLLPRLPSATPAPQPHKHIPLTRSNSSFTPDSPHSLHSQFLSPFLPLPGVSPLASPHSLTSAFPSPLVLVVQPSCPSLPQCNSDISLPSPSLSLFHLAVGPPRPSFFSLCQINYIVP